MKIIKSITMILAMALPQFSYAAPTMDTKDYIPYNEFTLPNGLRVIVHTDKKAPIVAVNVWYHVGSKNEPLGRSGFAHLFEHLMFQASENHPGEYFEPYKKIGVTEQNGTTNQDRTNYFQNVPSTAIDTALFMESDRMGHLLGAVSQAGLDEQRGVVQNEKRQGENRPYGRSWSTLFSSLYPKGHPYHRSIIGSMNDLNAATLDDVKTWFKSWYGPNNAVLVLAGDIDVETAKAKVMAYFGDIPASASVEKMTADLSKRKKATRETLMDAVPQTMVMKAWKIPGYGQKELAYLDLASDVLGGSATSRLKKRLEIDEKVVDSISTFAYGLEISGVFMIQAMVKNGVDAKKVEMMIDEEIAKFLKSGPTAEELAQTKSMNRAGFMKSLERVGGFGGKSDMLASCATYTGKVDCYKDNLNRIQNATANDVKMAAKNWLTKTEHTVLVVPGKVEIAKEEASAKVGKTMIPAADKKWKTIASTIDRKKGVPMPKEFPTFKFPELQKAKLDNGMNLLLVQRGGSPMVDISMQLEQGGFSTDPKGKEGLATFAMAMLKEGSKKYDKIELAKKIEMLGASMDANTNIDNGYIQISAPNENLEASLELFSETVMNPKFAKDDMERLRSQTLASLKQEKSNPNAIGSRVLPLLVYSKDHAYNTTESGFENTISALTADDLSAYHNSYVRPENATLVVIGDINLEKAKTLASKYFANFKANGKMPTVNVSTNFEPAKEAKVYLIDQPGAVQANIMASYLMPSSMEDNAVDFEAVNDVLGGDFTARLNMNLREDKHWSYGSRSSIRPAKGPRIFTASAPVQIDKTSEAVAEIHKEISQLINGEKPVQAEELSRIIATERLVLPGRFETNRAIGRQVLSNLRFGRSEDYVETRLKTLEAYTPEKLQEIATKVMNPEKLTWVVIGDLSKIKTGIEKLKLGKIEVIDADAKKI